MELDHDQQAASEQAAGQSQLAAGQPWRVGRSSLKAKMTILYHMLFHALIIGIIDLCALAFPLTAALRKQHSVERLAIPRLCTNECSLS